MNSQEINGINLKLLEQSKTVEKKPEFRRKK